MPKVSNANAPKNSKTQKQNQIAKIKRDRTRAAIAANTKYRPENCQIAREFCANCGGSWRSLAKLFQVGTTTIENWIKRYPEFKQAVKDGKELANDRVEQAMYSMATGHEYYEKETIVVNNKLITRKVKRKAMPNVNAGQFILKNQRREEYGERQTVEIVDRAKLLTEARLRAGMPGKTYDHEPE